MTACVHWVDVGLADGGRCALHGRTISWGICGQCPDAPEIGWVKAFLRRHRIGDKIERASGLIPGVKGLPCHDAAGRLKPDSGCAGRRDRANGTAPAS